MTLSCHSCLKWTQKKGIITRVSKCPWKDKIFCFGDLDNHTPSTAPKCEFDQLHNVYLNANNRIFLIMDSFMTQEVITNNLHCRDFRHLCLRVLIERSNKIPSPYINIQSKSWRKWIWKIHMKNENLCLWLQLLITYKIISSLTHTVKTSFSYSFHQSSWKLKAETKVDWV